MFEVKKLVNRLCVGKPSLHAQIGLGLEQYRAKMCMRTTVV